MKKEKQSTIVLDWLTLCTNINLSKCKQDDEFIYLSDDIIIEKTGNQSNDWGNIDRVLFQGYLIATITYTPKNLFNTSPYYVQFKLQNEDLYSGCWLEFYKVLKQVNSDVYSNHIDIAYDLSISGVKYCPITTLRRIKYHNEENKPYYIKKKGRAKITEESGTYYVGRKSSRKYIKVYNKSEELERSGKDYIKQFWVNNGIQLTDNSTVVRQEITLKTELAKSVNIEQLIDANYLESIIKTHCRNFYEFYYNNGQATNTINLIQFSERNNQVYNKPRRVINKLPMYKRVQRGLKTDVFKLLDAYLSDEHRRIDTITKSINDVISSYRLLDYFRNSFDYWIEDYRQQFANMVSAKDYYKRIEKVNVNNILSNNIATVITLESYIPVEKIIYKKKISI